MSHEWIEAYHEAHRDMFIEDVKERTRIAYSKEWSNDYIVKEESYEWAVGEAFVNGKEVHTVGASICYNGIGEA